jgi:hypothetical protein
MEDFVQNEVFLFVYVFVNVTIENTPNLVYAKYQLKKYF